jgi:hypothetical protein
MRTAIAAVAILLIVVGAVSLIYEGITYTRNRTVLQLGPIQAQVEEKRTVPLPPILGGISLAGGILLLIVLSNRSQVA